MIRHQPQHFCFHFSTQQVGTKIQGKQWNTDKQECLVLVRIHGPVNQSSHFRKNTKDTKGRHLLSSILGASLLSSWSSSSNCPSKASKDGMTSSDMLGLSLTYYANVLAISASAERCLIPSSSASSAHLFWSGPKSPRHWTSKIALLPHRTYLNYKTSTLGITMLHCEPNIEEPLTHFPMQLSEVPKGFQARWMERLKIV